jgi:hypothetical protein
MTNDLDDLIKRIESHANVASLCGVSVLLRPSDVFNLIEFAKDLQAERNVLRKTLEHITYETDNFSGIEAISIYGESVLNKLYAPRDYTQADRFKDDNPAVTYPQRQE